MKKIRLTCLAILMVACSILSISTSIPLTVFSADADSSTNSKYINLRNSNSYFLYHQKYKNTEKPDAIYNTELTKVTVADGAQVKMTNHEGRSNTLYWENGNGSVTFNINVENDGLYNLLLDYFPVASDKTSELEFKLYIDGSIAFKECEQISFPRLYRDTTYISITENDFETDNRGNEIAPQQTAVTQWMSWYIRDNTGAVKNPFEFYFSKGNHSITLVSLRDPIIIGAFAAVNRKPTESYPQYLESVSGNDLSNCITIVEAEKTSLKTDPALYPTSNKTSSATTPINPAYSCLNVFGGSEWGNPLQSVTWDFTVPKDGYYQIGMRYRQNFIKGLYTTRSIKIDGKLPFNEMDDIKFSYDTEWQLKVLGDDSPYYFYLTAGTHTITMTPTISELEQNLMVTDDAVTLLNEIYSNIVMITGTDPDLYRDYYLDEAIPGLTEKIKTAYETLISVSEDISKISGESGGIAAALDRICIQLQSFENKPDTIPTRLSSFQSNISAVASWVLDLRKQSLMLDKLYIIGSEDSFPSSKASFLKSVRYNIASFLYSFAGDYTSIGNAYDKKDSVYIWLNGSRDVAGVLKTLIDSNFTGKTGINVNANLTTVSLLAAIMADKGPDVAISVGHDEPVNLAARGAVLPLNGLDGFDDIIKDFPSTALTPYCYNGNCYALPVTLNYYMMFYRTDVFDSLEILPPATWEELYAVLEILQRNNMSVGLPYANNATNNLFYTLLFQNGGSLYNSDYTTTALNDPIAQNAFKMWSDLYTQYGVSLYKDDYNRFRTGEMPLVISYYSFYNQLYAAAPEIRNMWKMATIPGCIDENGSLNNVSAATSTACVLLSNAKNKSNAWEFIKWWVSGETQATYSIRVESMLGVIARSTPASDMAIKKIAWSNEEISTLIAQRNNIRETEEVPGSYYTIRNIDNAFKSVYYDSANPRQSLSRWNKEINSELERKRNEFKNAGYAITSQQ